ARATPEAGYERRRRRSRPPGWRDRISCGGLFRQPQLRGDLGHNGNRDLGRRDRADRQDDRSVNTGDISLSGALRLEAFAAPGVGLSRAQRADIETVAREGVQ